MTDPRTLGARCDRCPLVGSIVVEPERSRRDPPFAILVGEAPGEKEEEAGRPFVGAAGHELMRAMQVVGLTRANCHITNALLCRPASNKIDKAEKEATRRNAALRAQNPDISDDALWLSPIDACRPRLLREIAEFGRSNVIALGGVAYRALTDRRDKPMAVRGGPREEPFGRLLPTLHPSFVMRTRRWTHAFQADLGRAIRWFTTGLRWTDPDTIYHPSPSGLRAWLEREAGSPFVAYDVETAPAWPELERYDPMYDRLRCIGLASHDGKRATIVRFRSKTTPSALLYTMEEFFEFKAIFTEFFRSPRWRKVGHNAGYYDRMVMESHFKVTPRPLLDTIGLHKFSEPELPHGLDYVGSVNTDVSSWKQGHHLNENETDREEETYCVTDCVVTALSVGPLVASVEARNQTQQVKFWPFLQDLCVDLHKVGMYVDQEKRREWDSKLLGDAIRYLKTIREAAEWPDMNPGSFPQVADLLFDRWHLMPVGYTEGGDPSTDDDSLRSILAHQTLTPTQRAGIIGIRLYRRRTKYRGTYTLKLRPMNEAPEAEWFAFDEEESEDERTARRKREMKRKPGIVQADGRVHSDWNAHGTLGWRLSSSNTNLQNVPNRLRNIFAEEPGWKLVGCDQAQLELRLGAALARSESYLAAFKERRDPHREFCVDIFGDEFLNAGKDHQKTLRRFVKELTYASEYRAEVETVHNTLTSAEDDEEKILYPNVTMSQVGAMHRKWLGRARFERWWEETDMIYARQGWLAEPILGLRCDFLDGPDDPQIGNKLVNFLCQSGGAAVVHIATKRFIEEMPPEWRGKVFLVNQSHDALVARVRDEGDLPERVAKFLEECFTFPIGSFAGIDVEFLGEAKVGKNWKEV